MPYVVRKPFRNRGEVILPGTFVDPATVKFFKRRLSERVIVDVTKDSFKAWQAYFKSKLGVDLVWPEEQKTDGQKPEEQKTDGQKPEEQKTDGQKPEEQKTNSQKPDVPKVVVVTGKPV